MVVRFLGTGTSTGVPEIGCRCEVCTSSDKRDHRLRASVQIDVDGKNIIIDCTPDFRQQILNLPFRKIDGMLITHEHYDHTGGIDDLRPFGRFGTVNLYVEPDVARALEMRMPYYSLAINIECGYYVAQKSSIYPLFIDEVEVVPIRIIHYKMPILGYRIGNFAYLTDVKYVPEEEILKLKGVDTLVLSALRKKEHLSHENLDEAIALSRKINPRITYFTHMSHQIGLHSVIEKQLPPNMLFAYDGLEITV